MSKEKPSLKPEEQAELEKSRTISDAELLKDKEISLKRGEKFEDHPNAKARGYGGGMGLYVVEEGGKYVIQEGEKRLELAERQVAKARHEMLRSLGREAMRNENLVRIGLESIEGLPQYRLMESMPEGKIFLSQEDSPYTPLCCKLGDALGGNRSVGEYNDPKLVQEILKVFYSEHSELNNPKKPFLLQGDFGTVVVKGNMVEYLP